MKENRNNMKIEMKKIAAEDVSRLTTTLLKITIPDLNETLRLL